MNPTFKATLLLAILGLAFHALPASAEPSSDRHSNSASVNQKTDAKPNDQSGAKNSATTPRSDSTKESSKADKKDPAAPEVVVALQGPALFKVLDTDKNGRISAAEFIAYGAAADAQTNHTAPAPAADVGAKSAPAKPAHADHPTTAIPELPSPSAGILTSTSTRAGRFTAEVFEILDIDHDKFLTQAELDALVGAHQISQP